MPDQDVPGAAQRSGPPVPERRPKILDHHGDRRTDDWYWLGDRTDPSVLAHLQAENRYCEEQLAPLGALEHTLFEEIVARIEETDLSVPVRKDRWWYYTRTLEKKSYAVHCRRPAGPDELPPVGAAPSPDEEVLLDENTLAEGLDYFAVGNLAVSPDHQRLAYAIDTTGGELYDLHFKAVGQKNADDDASESVARTYYGLAWANDNATVFYVRPDEAMRPYQVWRHCLGTDPSTDVVVFQEDDERFGVSLGKTKDTSFVVVASHSTTTSEIWVIDADRPTSEAHVVEYRRPGVEYHVDHHRRAGGPGTFVIVTNDQAEDFRLMVAPDEAPGHGSWREVIPHRPGVRLDDASIFERWLVLSERLDGEPSLRVVALQDNDPFGGDLLGRSHLVEAAEHPSSTWEGANPEFTSHVLRFEQSSLVSPRAVFETDLDGDAVTLLKRQPVLGGYEPGDYRTFRTWATADDGTAVPVSIVHRADLVADPGSPDGSAPVTPAPCLLYGYGAYELSVDPVFSSLRLSLLDRGVVYAIAHVRGGGELGRRWYEDGKMAKKEHTFSDFIACAHHLVALGYTTPERLAARGGSAGGLLIGAVVNQAPELFKAVVAEVPFVDCLTTMLDASLPLTVGEWEEWGNPDADPEAYRTIKAYSPYDNIAPTTGRRHPDVLATGGLHDPRVGYWEPAKWVAKLRQADPRARVLLKTELDAGHGGPSGRYDAWREEAQVFAYILDELGLH